MAESLAPWTPLNQERSEMNEIHNAQDEEHLLEESSIQQFFNGTSILITGGSGFMGSVLIEKLLRSCPHLDQLFVLMRPKKGKTTEERLQNEFSGPLFDKLRAEHPQVLSKVVLITGDIGEENLGMSADDRDLLISKVNVIFHVAATVRFDEKLRIAVAVNVTGTKSVLHLAHSMAHLKAIVHISTAYANCPLKSIDEEFYPPGVSGEKLEQLCLCLDDHQLEAVLPSLLGQWPNTYAYTKAVAEDCVKRFSGDLPIAIVRPSIVINTAHEPVRGWVNNLYGPVGVTVGAGVGLLRTLHCDHRILADIVPVDLSINCILAAAWDIGVERSKQAVQSSADVAPIPIYNYVSSNNNKITWGEFMSYTEIGLEWPPINCLWYYCFTLNKYRFMHNLYVFFLHLIPACLTDGVLMLMGKKPKLWMAYKKVHKFVNVIAYFSTQQWKFSNANVNLLWSKLNPADQGLFNFNIAHLDWEEAMLNNIKGMRLYLLNDPISTVDQARRKYFKLKMAHYTIVSIFWMGICYFFFRIISLVF